MARRSTTPPAVRVPIQGIGTGALVQIARITPKQEPESVSWESADFRNTEQWEWLSANHVGYELLLGALDGKENRHYLFIKDVKAARRFIATFGDNPEHRYWDDGDDDREAAVGWVAT